VWDLGNNRPVAGGAHFVFPGPKIKPSRGGEGAAPNYRADRFSGAGGQGLPGWLRGERRLRVSEYQVSLRTVAACPTAVVRRTTTWEEFPRLWRQLLDEVYAFVRAGGAIQQGDNVMLYRDDAPNVEVGIQVAETFTPHGGVVPSVLPGGQVATTVHRGAYDGLAAAHRAIRAWCVARGHQLSGIRWEVYGDWHDNPEELETEVSYLITS
jgi:effector-binding domain-containing protein